MKSIEDRSNGYVLGPYDLAVIGRVYEDTASILQMDAGPYAGIPQNERNDLVARAVLQAALVGDRDLRRLEQATLQNLARGMAGSRARTQSPPRA